MYIYEQPQWPDFFWDKKQVNDLLFDVRFQQGQLIGTMKGLGFGLHREALLATLTEDVIKSSDIEGETLDRAQVRSSIARRLGLDIAGLIQADRNVEGVVDMMLDATQSYKAPLTQERLFEWHKSLFPDGFAGLVHINVGVWRKDATGPMQVVSGPIGKERVHFQAPEATRLCADMETFLSWFSQENTLDPVIVSAISHLWFVTIHPFDDGNGRIARAIADMALARSEDSSQRFYSMSSQIRAERTCYYDILEATQKGDLDITDWLIWFLSCLSRAFDSAELILANVIAKAHFWDTLQGKSLSLRQSLVINRLLDGFEGKLTTDKWAKLCKCSQDTAARDIDDLIGRGILRRSAAGGRSTSYTLVGFDDQP